MSELQNYSVETDNIVLLEYRDGRSLRVRVPDLPAHLTAQELRKVRRALKLRGDFLRDHFPKTLVAAAAAGLAAIALVSNPSVAHIWSGAGTAPAVPLPVARVSKLKPSPPTTPTATPVPPVAAQAQVVTPPAVPAADVHRSAESDLHHANPSLPPTAQHPAAPALIKPVFNALDDTGSTIDGTLDSLLN